MSRRLLALLLAIVAACMLAAGCGSDEPDEDSTSTTKTTRTDATDPGDDQDLPPIQVTSPKSFQSVYRSFTLEGTAAVHEGTIAWQILDADLKPMLVGYTTASCGAPCRGDFSAEIDVRDVKAGSWELHVFQQPVADDDPERVHDTLVPITITTGPVDDQPDPDAPPPGGVPG